jgi:hypothetical protein
MEPAPAAGACSRIGQQLGEPNFRKTGHRFLVNRGMVMVLAPSK